MHHMNLRVTDFYFSPGLEGNTRFSNEEFILLLEPMLEPLVLMTHALERGFEGVNLLEPFDLLEQFCVVTCVNCVIFFCRSSLSLFIKLLVSREVRNSFTDNSLFSHLH